MPSSSMQPLSATADATGTLTSICQELRDYLQRERRLVDEQIRTYPTPIPRCDVQFNDLYERRTRLSQALQRVSGLLDRHGDHHQACCVRWGAQTLSSLHRR